jgi:hypothetical protein
MGRQEGLNDSLDNEVFQPPREKDVDEELLSDLRRLLAAARRLDQE